MKGVTLSCLVLYILFTLCLSAIPTGELTTRKIMGTTTVVLVAPGSFSSALISETDSVFIRLVKPTSGLDGCNPIAPPLRNNLGFYLLVSRGNCSFIDKAIAAKNAGALGVVVYNSLQGIYQGLDYASPTDYECKNGMGYVKTVLDPVYSDEMDTSMPTVCTQHPNCASKRCLVTNYTDPVYGTQVCCAWDLYTTMGSPYATQDDETMPNVPAVFIRMQDADTLMKFDELSQLTLEVALFSRPSSMFDFASIIIWLIAVVTVTSGATLAAEEDKLQQNGLKGSKTGYYDSDSSSMIGEPHFIREPQQRNGQTVVVSNQTGNTMTAASSSGATMTAVSIDLEDGAQSFLTNHTVSPQKNSSFQGNPVARIAHVVDSDPPALATASIDSTATRSVPLRRGNLEGTMLPRGKNPHNGGMTSSPLTKTLSPMRHNDGNNDIDSESLQITAYHAVGFVVLSSCFLLLMYFVDVYAFVSVLYLSAAAFATSKVFFYPFFKRVQSTCKAIQLGIEIEDVPEYDALSDSHWYCDTPLISSAFLSVVLSAIWFIHSEEIKWVWVIQDFLGVSVCIMFLSTVHLPNLQASSILLGLAFCYDVFFVFISPYVFGSSVMVKVATGPTVAQHSDENFCEKYPTNRDCNTNTMPMLLIVPTFSSYLSSESMLGLGDIVLPGLLLVWAARLDIRSYGSLSSPYASKGYFPMVVFGYAIGLMTANFAVEYFETGQPALLYIVPLTLGPALYRSFKAGSLPELWRGLPRMKTIAQPFDRAEQEALLSGRTNVFPAEASWSHEKAAEFNVDTHSFGRSVLMEQVTFESYNSAAISSRPLPTIPPSGGSSRRTAGGGSRNDGLI